MPGHTLADMNTNHAPSGLDLEQVVAEARAVTAERDRLDEQGAEEDWANDWLEGDDWLGGDGWAAEDQSADLTMALAAIDRLAPRWRHAQAQHREEVLARDAQVQRVQFLTALGLDPTPRHP